MLVTFDSADEPCDVIKIDRAAFKSLKKNYAARYFHLSITKQFCTTSVELVGDKYGYLMFYKHFISTRSEMKKFAGLFH